MTHTRIASAALAALALLVPAAAAAPASAHAAILGPNQVTTGDDVPWSQVGHGWYLTLVDQGPQGEFGIDPHHQLLDLVDPLGGRYQLAKTAVGKNGSNYRHLSDWSTDGHRAIELVDTPGSQQKAVVYDLEAGTHRRTDLGRGITGAVFADHGSLYLTKIGGAKGSPLLRLNDDGPTEVLRRHTDGAALATPSGRQVVTGTSATTDHRLLVIGQGGSLVGTLKTPADCTPTRWWSKGVVMASCLVGKRLTERLYAAPLDGSAGHWITLAHGRKSADLGDLDARTLHGTTYIEAAGPCGVVFLARQHRNGAATKVTVPKATQNVYLIGKRGNSLVLHMGVSCDGGTSRDALTHFDPTTGRNRIVAMLPLDEAYGTILGFDEHPVPVG
jgi:TolB protein